MGAPIGIQASPRSKSRRSKSKPARPCAHKPRGALGPRVKKLRADKFALVCVDPAKHRSEWMMAVSKAATPCCPCGCGNGR